MIVRVDGTVQIVGKIGMSAYHRRVVTMQPAKILQVHTRVVVEMDGKG